MGLAELSNVLWRQRQLLDLLLFRMTVEQTLLVSRQVRWLSRATDEVEAVLDEMRETELVRSVVVDRVAAELSLDHAPSLRELAAVAPAPWSEILDEHRNCFLALTDEVQTLAKSNRDLLGREQRATNELLDQLMGKERAAAGASYGKTTLGTGAIVLDEAL